MRTIFSIFLVIFVTLPAHAGKKAVKAEVCEMLVASPKQIQRVLGYSPEVLTRIKKHRPQLYREIMDAAATKDTKKVERYKAISAFRGIARLPEDYNAGFTGNKFFTQPGEIWFSTESSIAWNYSDLDDDSGFRSYEEILADGYKYWGVMIAVELPQYMAEESFHARYRDFSVMREDLGNESVFITEVSVQFLSRSGDVTQKMMSYKAFKSRFGAKNKSLL